MNTGSRHAPFPTGLLIGHAEHSSGLTGVTVVLTPQGASGGASVRGGAPGSRETDLLRPGNLVDQVHGVVEHPRE